MKIDYSIKEIAQEISINRDYKSNLTEEFVEVNTYEY